MIHIAAIIKATGAMSGIAFAAVAFGALADVINAGTPITLGGALSVGSVVVGGVWYLSSRLQKFDDRLKNIEKNCLMCRNTDKKPTNKP